MRDGDFRDPGDLGPGVDPSEIDYLALKQPGARKRLLNTPLDELETVADLVRILQLLDQANWIDERGLHHD